MAKILIVDDNEQLNSMLKDVIESWGHEVLLANDGLQALDTVRENYPDIILLDVMLPGLSGYEFCSRLKKDSMTAKIAIIMMTALADQESRIHGFKVGADNFLVKPINYDEIKAIMNKLLQQKRYYDLTESPGSVATMLHRLLMTLPENDDEEFAEMPKIYCDKLLERLNWTEYEENQARIAVLLAPVIESKLEEKGEDKVFDILTPLSMSTWLIPLLRFLSTDKAKRQAARPMMQEKNCQKAGELAFIVCRYTTLLHENRQDKELALAMLKRELDINDVNKAILQNMEEIVQAEKFLEEVYGGL